MLSPTQSSRKVTFLLRSEESWSATGLRLILAFFLPSGLPRWDSKTKDLGLCLVMAWIVGKVSRLDCEVTDDSSGISYFSFLDGDIEVSSHQNLRRWVEEFGKMLKCCFSKHIYF
jgi:hypothetical protein